MADCAPWTCCAIQAYLRVMAFVKGVSARCGPVPSSPALRHACCTGPDILLCFAAVLSSVHINCTSVGHALHGFSK